MALLIQNLDYAVSFACLIFAAHILGVKAKNPLPARLLGVGFLILAVQAALLYLITLFGRPSLPASLLPAMPLLLGPTIFLFFKSAANPRFKFKLLHTIYVLPAIFVTALMVSGQILILVDLTVLLSQFAYAAALFLMARKGSPAFTANGVYADSISRWLWLAAGYFLIMALADTAIYLEIQSGKTPDQALSIMFTLLFKLMLVAFMLLMALQNSRYFEWVYNVGAQSADDGGATIDDEEMAGFQALVDALQEELSKPDFYEEAPPSLKEMAFRLGAPIRQLSRAVNHIHGESYSRYLNRQRIERAKTYIRQHPNAAMIDVMFEAGFRSKSSFNKEFKAIEGVSPSDYRDNFSG